MTRDTALTAKEIERLTSALEKLKRANPYPGCDSRIEQIRCLVLWPNLEDWNRLHRTALDPGKTISLWQATCNVSDYPAVVPTDQSGRRYWQSAPAALTLLRALEFAFA